MEITELATEKSRKKSKSLRGLTKTEYDMTPLWIRNLCNYWSSVISRFMINDEAYDFYNLKITALLTVIRPAILIGVENWVSLGGNKRPEKRRRILIDNIEGIIKIIDILGTEKNPVYQQALIELNALSKEISQEAEKPVTVKSDSFEKVH